MQITSAKFIAKDYTKGDIELTISAEECFSEDVEINLEAGINTQAGVEVEGYRTVYNNRAGSIATYTFEDIDYGDYYVKLRDDFDYEDTQAIFLEEVLINVGQTFVETMRSNSLRFIEKSEILNPSTLDNKHYNQVDFKNILNSPFCQKYNQDSNLWFQFKTNMGLDVFLIDSDFNETDITSTVSVVKVDGLTAWRKVKPVITNLDGVYKIKCVFSAQDTEDQIWFSEPFEVRENHEGTIKVQYYNTLDRYTYIDGIEWEEDEPQEMIIEGEYFKQGFGADKTVQTDTNNRLINTKTYPSRIDVINIYKMSHLMHETFLLASMHYKFFVNGIEYQNQDDIEMEAYEGTALYHGQIELRRVNFEIY